MSETVEKLNVMFTVIYTVELLINLTAMGFRCYYSGSYFNIFDSFIVGLSIVDIIITDSIPSRSTETGSIITVMRGFRLLRVFKLAKSWLRFGLLLEVMARTLYDVGTFSILIGLFMFTFTLLGMELFAHEAKFTNDMVDPVHGTSPRYNFDNFMNAFFTVFVTLTNDATTEVWMSYHRTVDPTSSTIFFILLIVLGQRLLLNIFLAILLQNFDEGALRQKMQEFSLKQREIRRKMIGVKTIGERILGWVNYKFRK